MSTAHPSIASYMTAASQGQQSTAYREEEPEENLLDEDGDDVFSNPDTAELESSRSDATGTTSPTPNSPGPSSPSNRVGSHIAIASQYADPFNTLKQSDFSSSSHPKQGINSLIFDDYTTSNNDISQSRNHFSEQLSVETPKAASPSPPMMQLRPQFGRTLSASGAESQFIAPLTGLANRSATPRMGGHMSSLSASYLNHSFPHVQHLPSAHDMPSDPREASEVLKLFARPPAQSSCEESTSLDLGLAPIIPESSNLMQSSTTPSSLLATSSPTTSRLRSRPNTRPPSPDHFSSQPKSSVIAGLGLVPLAKSNHVIGDASETSIFERDIEHRDAGHVLSKQEAIDVAIPSVLDDAVEALTCEDGQQIEIVSPHAAPPILALSAQALSVHSHNHGSKLQSPLISSTNSPAHSPSPPLSNSGGVEAPLGTMAAQIAERLAIKSTSSPEEVITTQSNTPSRHRRPNSDVSSSSSVRSRSPQASLPVGVQQVLDANLNSTVPTTTSNAARSLSVSPALLAAPSKSTSLATTPQSASSPQANFTLPAPAVSISPSQTTALPIATALPALPLPNPFRSYSPPPSAPLAADGGMSMASSVSMDGAVMTTSESATMEASLGSLADVIASIHNSNSITRRKSGSSTGPMNSPFTQTKALAAEEEVGPYSSRSTYNVSPTLPHDRSIPGSFPSELSHDDLIAANQLRTNKSSTSSVVAKKRLSFFSYADIINKTPADLIDLDAAIRQADDAITSSTMNN